MPQCLRQIDTYLQIVIFQNKWLSVTLAQQLFSINSIEYYTRQDQEKVQEASGGCIIRGHNMQ